MRPAPQFSHCTTGLNAGLAIPPVRSHEIGLAHVSTPARVAAPACTNLPNRNQMRKKQTKLDNTLRPGGHYAPSTKPSGFNMILASSTISKRVISEGISPGELSTFEELVALLQR